MWVITGKRSASLRTLRRPVLAGLAAALLTAWAPALTAAADDELTVVSWGGAYTRSQLLGFVRDFEQETGIDVEMVDYAGGIEEIRSQVRAWNVKWDIVDLQLYDAIRACDDDLLVEIDFATLPPAPDGTAAADDSGMGADRRRRGAGTRLRGAGDRGPRRPGLRDAHEAQAPHRVVEPRRGGGATARDRPRGHDQCVQRAHPQRGAAGRAFLDPVGSPRALYRRLGNPETH